MTKITKAGEKDMEFLASAAELMLILIYLWLYVTKKERLIRWEDRYIIAPLRRLFSQIKIIIAKRLKKSNRFMKWLNAPPKHSRFCKILLSDDAEHMPVRLINDWRNNHVK